MRDFFQKLLQTFPAVRNRGWPFAPNSLTPLWSTCILLLLGCPPKRSLSNPADRHRGIAESQEIILRRQKQTNKLLELLSIRRDCLEVLHLWQYPKPEELSLILKIPILRRGHWTSWPSKVSNLFFFSPLFVWSLNVLGISD